jgi:SAM-dependent methyltransferase
MLEAGELVFDVDFAVSVLKVFVVLYTCGVVWVLWTRLRGAPWVPTPLRIAHKMLDLAQVQPGELLYDLGSGDGRIVVLAARRFGARAVGIEIDPLRYLMTRAAVSVLGVNGQVEVVLGDFFKQDLSRADVITVFLLQDTNDLLSLKLVEELRPGTRVVSYKSGFSVLTPLRQDEADRIFVYVKQGPEASYKP